MRKSERYVPLPNLYELGLSTPDQEYQLNFENIAVLFAYAQLLIETFINWDDQENAEHSSQDLSKIASAMMTHIRLTKGRNNAFGCAIEVSRTNLGNKKSKRAAELIYLVDPNMDLILGKMFNNVRSIEIDLLVTYQNIIIEILSHPSIPHDEKIDLAESMFEFFNILSDEAKNEVFAIYINFFVSLTNIGIPVGSLNTFDWEFAKEYFGDPYFYQPLFQILGTAQIDTVNELIDSNFDDIIGTYTGPLTPASIRAELLLLEADDFSESDRSHLLICRVIGVATEIIKSNHLAISGDSTQAAEREWGSLYDLLDLIDIHATVFSEAGDLSRVIDLEFINLYFDLLEAISWSQGTSYYLDGDTNSGPVLNIRNKFDQLSQTLFGPRSLGDVEHAFMIAEVMENYLQNIKEHLYKVIRSEVIIDFFLKINPEVLRARDAKFGLIWIRLLSQNNGAFYMEVLEVLRERLYMGNKAQMKLDVKDAKGPMELLNLIDEL